MRHRSSRPFLALLRLALLLAAATMGTAAAGSGVRAGDTADRAELAAKIESYLNSIETLRADFLQIAPDGGLSTGTLLIDRPDLMRIDYAPPVPVQIIADGRWLIYYDEELDEASYTSLRDSLAGFLLREEIRFSGDVKLRRVERNKGVVRVTLTQRDAPEAGTLTLVFSDDPLQLRQWTVTDGSGDSTRVALENPVFNGEIDPEAFEFTRPEPGGYRE